MSNFFFCPHVFKKRSATEASESVYMRERVKMSVYVNGYISTLKAFLICEFWLTSCRIHTTHNMYLHSIIETFYYNIVRTVKLSPFPHIDAFWPSVDDFWKHRDKWRNCSNRAIPPFATMFSTFVCNYTYNYRDFPCL